MNPRTLGGLCTTRIGKADIEVASVMVAMYASMTPLNYPRGNFSIRSNAQQKCIDVR